MKKPFLAALLAAALPLTGTAAEPADPAAAAPRLPYRSAFEGTTSGVVEDSVDWKKANAEVGQFRRGHIDLLKWEEAQQGGGAAPAASAGPAAPAAPAASAPARAQPPRGHQH